MSETHISFEPQRFLAAVYESLEELKKSRVGPLLADRHGGYFAFTDQVGRPLLLSLIGTVPHEKLDRYRTFCLEKAARLASHVSHDLSRESRNPAKDQYGGAIKSLPYILSFSGLPEELDELLMFMVAVKTGVMRKDVARDRFYHFPTPYAQMSINDAWKID